MPSRAMTPPALKRPTALPSKTHVRCAVDLLDVRHAIAVLGRSAAGEQVGGLGPVGVSVDDQLIV